MSEDPFAFLDDARPDTDAREWIDTHVMDELPDGVSEADAAQAFAYHMIWKMQQPKTIATVRKHMLAKNRFLLRLAEIQPDLFDEVMCAYAERALTFDQPMRPSPSVVSADQTHAHVKHERNT